MAVITLIILLVPLVSATYVERKLIGELNDHFNIDHNLFLLDTSVNLNRFINSEAQPRNCIPQSVVIFRCDQVEDASGIEFLDNPKAKNELLIVTSSATTYNSNLSLLLRIKAIQRRRLNIKIGLFFSHFVSDDLHQLFNWAFKNRIINIFAATLINIDYRGMGRKVNIFTYNPFGTFRVIDVTGEPFEQFFLSQQSNFQQHPLQFGAKDESGRSEKVWSTIFRMLNCSQNTINSFVKQINSSEHPAIDIILLHTKSDLRPFTLYPVEMPRFTILVPEALPYSELISYLQNIVSHEFWLYCTVALIVVISLLCVGRYKKRKRFEFLRCVSDILNLLMNDNYGIKYQQLNRIEMIIIVPLTFMGLVIMNGIASQLQSHITRPYLQPQIETFEDIYR